MQMAICSEFKLPAPPEPADVADALAIQTALHDSFGLLLARYLITFSNPLLVRAAHREAEVRDNGCEVDGEVLHDADFIG